MRGGDPLENPERLIRRVYSYVAYRIGDGPDAQDVTSETFARALRRRASYDPARGTPTAWLLGIARNCLTETMANRLNTTPEPPEQTDRGDLADAAVARLTLEQAIATLDEREQDLIALRYGSDLTARRIAEILGMETNAVEVALHRTLRRLRDRLEDGAADATPSGSRAVTVEP